MSVVTEADGGPLGITIAGANVYDTKFLAETLNAIVVDRPQSTQHLCLDKGYDNPTGRAAVKDASYPSYWRRKVR